MLSKMQIIFICNMERLKMAYGLKDLGFTWLVAVMVSAMGLALPTARQ